MPRPYSSDLRERVLLACERGDGSRGDIAQRFQVCESTLYNWLKLAREHGRRQAKQQGRGRTPSIDTAGRDVLCALVAADGNATLAEYAERYEAITGRRVSIAGVCRTLQHLGLTRRKTRSGRVIGRQVAASPRATKDAVEATKALPR